ncbi:acyl-CoA-binding domain-containing protein 1 isoform X2 [Tripterygium wilfordii]|uniref:acyl-CoA-binding domain-containing protein 1 isoform X2 n=1 Tax=Tripterygium wilfordii TaxID=458696 RepID=UPI0018F845DD|nr:acyl-CoA-binding domain-containing protein 1 isoform X2 [Tripterygium wilfordii]
MAAMGDWQQLIQSVLIGLVFSYLLAKLISIVVAFKDENLTVTRNFSAETQPQEQTRPEAKIIEGGSEDFGGRAHDLDSLIGEHGSVRNESLPGSDNDDDDDWEGVESTELDEAFSAATAFVATAAADRLSQKVSNELQLQLYGLYKIATEGPCSTPQPSALKMSARAKWQAWQKMGAMPPEEAMLKYIEIVTELYPTWASGSSMRKAGNDGASSAEAKGPMGPVFSSFVYEEEGGNELKMDAIHAFAREGEVDNLLKCIESGVSVDAKDSEGRTPLHWAVDRGHLNIVEKLVGRNADVNTKDNEGQTPLHYAAVCEREVVAEFLVKHNAEINVKDNSGDSPCDLCDSKWNCMQLAGEQK